MYWYVEKEKMSIEMAEEKMKNLEKEVHELHLILLAATLGD